MQHARCGLYTGYRNLNNGGRAGDDKGDSDDNNIHCRDDNDDFSNTKIFQRGYRDNLGMVVLISTSVDIIFQIFFCEMK